MNLAETFERVAKAVPEIADLGGGVTLVRYATTWGVKGLDPGQTFSLYDATAQTLIIGACIKYLSRCGTDARKTVRAAEALLVSVEAHAKGGE